MHHQAASWSEVVPIEQRLQWRTAPSSSGTRTIIDTNWGCMKIDVLALGMLTCLLQARLRHAARSLRRGQPHRHGGRDGTSHRYRRSDGRAPSYVFDAVQARRFGRRVPGGKPGADDDAAAAPARANSTTWSIEVAIVRPGPIQGDMVHPYLRNRLQFREAEARGESFAVAFPAPSPEDGPANEVQNMLGKHAAAYRCSRSRRCSIAIVAAEVHARRRRTTLRRAMATFRRIRGRSTALEDAVHGRRHDPE